MAASTEDEQKAILVNNEGMELANEGKYAEAEKKFHSAADLAPSHYLIQCNFGFVLMKLGRLVEAIQHLEKSTQLKSDFPLSWLNLGVAQQARGDAKSAIVSFEKYVSLSQPSEEVERIKGQLTLLKEESSIKTGDTSNTDYVASITARNKLRWPKSRMPVKVYIKPANGLQNFKPEYQDLLKKAFDDWVTAAAGNISVSYVDSAKNADITAEWTNDTQGIVNLAEGGDTQFAGDGQGMEKAHIRLLLLDPKPQKLTPSLVRWITMHEVGHALGLLGHSPDPADIMYVNQPTTDSMAELTARDTTTIRKFYTTDLGDSWLSLNDAGIEAVDKGEYALAVKNYEKSIALAPSEGAPRKNLIRAHYSWAISLIKKGDMKGPEEHFKKALDLEMKNKD
ncbi:MAG: matrixin family metalloprotease, partial [Cyanobacteria bacterium]|nr:matrixin family metalloprotease [Cyanobacteriota bacterium]